MHDDEPLRRAFHSWQAPPAPALDEILARKVRRRRIRPAMVAMVFIIAGAGFYHAHQKAPPQELVSMTYPPTTDWLLTDQTSSEVQR
jgi:disulfide bond formation protein DsbB